MSIVLTSFLSAIFAFLVFGGGAVLIYVAVKRRIKSLLDDFVVAPNPNTPSNLAQIVNNGCVLLANHLVAQAKATLMGMYSGDARNEAKENEQANPLIGILGAVFPKKVARALGGNPIISELAMSYISKKALAGRQPGQDNNHKIQQQFPL